MSALAQALLAASQAVTPDRESLTDIQITTRLREVFALRSEEYEFEPGDIIIHKYPSMASINSSHEPHVFLEYLPEPLNGFEFSGDISELFTSAGAITVDCRIGFISGGVFHLMLTDSRNFRPHPDFTDEIKAAVQ